MVPYTYCLATGVGRSASCAEVPSQCRWSNRGSGDMLKPRVSSASPSELNVTQGIEAEKQSGERLGLHFTQLIQTATSLTARHETRPCKFRN